MSDPSEAGAEDRERQVLAASNHPDELIAELDRQSPVRADMRLAEIRSQLPPIAAAVIAAANHLAALKDAEADP